jgi:NhaP-type Na+/H+ or K+/H+ antiporter
MLNIAAVCIVITALLAYLNYRFFKMPTTIGVMAASLVFSLALVALDALGFAHALREYEVSLVRAIDFSDVLMQGMLAMVVAGLIIGNDGRALAMSDTTRHYVDMFWELIDEILNATLFVLMGMEVCWSPSHSRTAWLPSWPCWSRCWRALSLWAYRYGSDHSALTCLLAPGRC